MKHFFGQVTFALKYEINKAVQLTKLKQTAQVGQTTAKAWALFARCFMKLA